MGKKLKIQLPDDQYQSLIKLAQQKQTTSNKLIEELTTEALTQLDAETRFRAMAKRGDIKKGLAILDKLDCKFSKL